VGLFCRWGVYFFFRLLFYLDIYFLFLSIISLSFPIKLPRRCRPCKKIKAAVVSLESEVTALHAQLSDTKSQLQALLTTSKPPPTFLHPQTSPQAPQPPPSFAPFSPGGDGREGEAQGLARRVDFGDGDDDPGGGGGGGGGGEGRLSPQPRKADGVGGKQASSFLSPEPSTPMGRRVGSLATPHSPQSGRGGTDWRQELKEERRM